MRISVFRTSQGVGRTAVCAIYARGVPCIDLRANSVCQVFADDNDLGTLIENAHLNAVIIRQNINFS